MTTYRLWPSTNGPSTPQTYTGNFISGVTFYVTAEAWFMGYWWWVCPSGQSTSAVKCALWQAPYVTGDSPTLIPGSVVTSGTLTAGQWNWIPLATPIALSLGGSSGMSPALTVPGGCATYVAAIGCDGAFPDTNNYWGTGQTAPDGITNGPLTAFSGKSAGMPAPWPTNSAQPQGCFSVAGSDPSVTFPGSASNTDNFWVDVEVGDHFQAPSGTSYRLWPSYPAPADSAGIDNTQQTMGTEFTLSGSCTLNNIWFYSPPGVSVLPSRCAIWKVSSQTEVSGTDNSSPSWSGAAGSGWVSCAYSGVTLPAGDYKVSVYYGGGSEFYNEVNGYFENGGAGWNGITNGPLSAPNTTNASGGIQDTFTSGAWAYPATSGGTGAQTRWLDVEVTPLGSSHTATASLTVTPSFSAARTRGKFRTAALSVSPSFSAARTRGKYRSGSLTVSPSFSAARAAGHVRGASLLVVPSFSAIATGGAFAPPVFIYPALRSVQWAQAQARVTVSPAGPLAAATSAEVSGEGRGTLYPPETAVIYPSP